MEGKLKENLVYIKLSAPNIVYLFGMTVILKKTT